jgi:hypothetical protein
MFKLSGKNKQEYQKLIAEFKASGDDDAIATSKAIDKLKKDKKISEKTYTSFSEFVAEEAFDVNGDGVIDNADVLIALEELEVTTTLEDDLIEFLMVSAEEDIIPNDMIPGLFELISDHVDLSDEEEDDVTEDFEIEHCDIEEVRAKALIKKKGGKRRVRCTSGPNKGRIRVAGQCGKKVSLKLSRKLKRSKKRISAAKKSLAAKKAQRTAKRRGTR